MKKSEWVDKVLKLKPQDRIKKFKGQKKELAKKAQNRIKRTQKLQKRKLMPFQIIQICNQNKIYTIRSLNQYNRTHQLKISVRTILYWFGSWSRFKMRLNYVDSSIQDYTYDQVIDACIRFQINSKQQYLNANKKQPALFPKYNWVVRNFGCWKYFKKVLQACSVQHMLWSYVKKKIQLGRYPTRGQCKKNNIQLQMLQQIWSNDQLVQLVKILQEIYKDAKK